MASKFGSVWLLQLKKRRTRMDSRNLKIKFQRRTKARPVRRISRGKRKVRSQPSKSQMTSQRWERTLSNPRQRNKKWRRKEAM